MPYTPNLPSTPYTAGLPSTPSLPYMEIAAR